MNNILLINLQKWNLNNRSLLFPDKRDYIFKVSNSFSNLFKICLSQLY